MRDKLYVYAENELYKEDADALAEHLQVDVIRQMEEAGSEDLVLHFSEEGLALVGGDLVLRADFTAMLPRIRGTMWQHELLAKASKLKKAEGRLTALDATAGLGEDSLILAAAGYEVFMYEYDPVIAALLKDAMKRAKKNPQLASMVGRMHLMEADSIAAMKNDTTPLSLIYLDPMFPARQKSALIKKKFQLLQKLESPCMDEQALLEAALMRKPQRIVIKRPAKGPYMAGRKPQFSYQGKAIRYDCFSC